MMPIQLFYGLFGVLLGLLIWDRIQRVKPRTANDECEVVQVLSGKHTVYMRKTDDVYTLYPYSWDGNVDCERADILSFTVNDAIALDVTYEDDVTTVRARKTKGR